MAGCAPGSPPSARIGSAYLKASGIALAARLPPPDESALEQAFVAALDEAAALRREGFTRELSDEDAGRFFTLAFALQDLRRTLRGPSATTLEISAREPNGD